MKGVVAVGVRASGHRVQQGQQQQQLQPRQRGAAVVVRASDGEGEEVDLDKNLSKFARNTASTFAPSRSAGAKKNPAFKGSVLYSIFEYQAYASFVVGSLLAFNVIWPTDEPSIARLLGMWSVWMFAVPSLRARECDPKEKDALNVLFIAIPLINVLIPFVWKSFPGVFTADCLLMTYMYYNKGAGIFNNGEEAEAKPEEEAA